MLTSMIAHGVIQIFLGAVVAVDEEKLQTEIFSSLALISLLSVFTNKSAASKLNIRSDSGRV